MDAKERGECPEGLGELGVEEHGGTTAGADDVWADKGGNDDLDEGDDDESRGGAVVDDGRLGVKID
jgi:hypothetical protein